MAHGRTKQGLNTQTWEQSEFPIVCETCLGNNPYLRMTKEPTGKECKICTRPFTIFRWRPGTEARYKKTEVCQTCAKLKNVCQTCLLDLEYGLPTQVRDAALMGGAEQALLPQSDVNREYMAGQADRLVAAGALPYGRAPVGNQVLNRLARRTPRYERNLPHICSFFVKGTCTRGDACPYRHEQPKDDPELAKQNFKDRFYGNNDPVANRMLHKIADSGFVPQPPEDQAITTLWVGGLQPQHTEADLRDAMYAHGEIRSVRLVPRGQCAFVTFATRASAEAAVAALHHALVLHGTPLKVAWARPHSVDPAAARSAAPPPPPGLEQPGAAPYYPSMDPANFGSRPARAPSTAGGDH